MGKLPIMLSPDLNGGPGSKWGPSKCGLNPQKDLDTGIEMKINPWGVRVNSGDS